MDYNRSLLPNVQLEVLLGVIVKTFRSRGSPKLLYLILYRSQKLSLSHFQTQTQTPPQQAKKIQMEMVRNIKEGFGVASCGLDRFLV